MVRRRKSWEPLAAGFFPAQGFLAFLDPVFDYSFPSYTRERL
jgi:hypothetical protein